MLNIINWIFNLEDMNRYSIVVKEKKFLWEIEY